MAKGRILAIDDELYSRRFYGEVLSPEGYQVRTASKPQDGLDILQREDFDLVIIDMDMSEMSGVEFAQAVRSDHPEQDIIVVTSKDDVGLAVEAMKYGVAEYLLKPLNPEEFLLVISRLLFRQSQGREHQQLMQENIEFASILGYYRKCLTLLRIHDLDRLGDLILDTMMELLRAEGGLLWLVSYGGRNFRLRCRRGLAQPLAGEDNWLPDAMQLRQLEMGEPTIDKKGVNLWLPLVMDQEPLAVIRVETPTGRKRFGRRDLKLAEVIGEFASCALANVLTLRRAEHGSLRQPSSEAYRMPIFRDHVARELHKARRYGRNLSVIKLTIENHAELATRFRERELSDAIQRLVGTVNTVLRDADIMGQPAPGDFYILLPETDYWGSLVLQRRIRRALVGQLTVCDLKKSYPIEMLLRSASFPTDGENFDQLSDVIERRLERLHYSLYYRTKFDELEFWDIVGNLFGSPQDFRLDGRMLRVAPHLATYESSMISRYVRMPAERFGAILRAFCREVVESSRVRGIIYLSCSNFEEARRNLPHLRELEESSTTVFLVGGDRRVTWDLNNIMPIFIDDSRFKQADFLLYLNEDYAYGLFTQKRGDDLIGFHTADFYFVENMIAKLQLQYQLQPRI